MDKIYKPLSGNVIIQVKIPTKTESGIVLPESSRAPESFATVVAVADNITDVKVGDRVLLKNESHEIVPQKRVVILTSDIPDAELYFVQITVGTIMGVVTEEFEELAKKVYEKEMNKAKEYDQAKNVRESIIKGTPADNPFTVIE
jgi:co-chaperonin GroES (HSP10)